MKNILCLLRLHKYEKEQVYVGGDDWILREKCVRCNHTRNEENIKWHTTRRLQLRDAA
jgi:hypothetical protein